MRAQRLPKAMIAPARVGLVPGKAVSEPPSKLPQRIGRYEVLTELAVGGMAVVYLAIEHGDHGLQRPVVVKQILPRHTRDDSFRRMLLQEAKIAARISHPNVVQIHELGAEDGLPFIVMEYLGGVNLREVTRKAAEAGRPVPVGVALGLCIQACAGAHAAHELHGPDGQPAQLVHRDLTPHNLVVNPEGHLKVLDFGVAKASFSQEKTRTGVLKGKVSYMSPEQLYQKPLDRRSDLFALGSVLWELLEGRALFRRDTEIATMHAVLNMAIPDLSERRSDVPPELMAAMKKSLRRNPDQRYASADEMRKALVEVASAKGIDVSVDSIGEFIGGLMQELLANREQLVKSMVARSVRSPRDVTETASTMVDAPMEGRGTPASSVAADLPVTITARAPPPRLAWKGPVLGAAVAVLALSLGLLAVSWWRGGEPEETPPIDDEAQAMIDRHVTPEGETLRVALAPTVESALLREDLEPLRIYLEREMDRPVKWLTPPTYEDAARLLVEGDVPFASLTAYLYVKTQSEHPDLELVAVKEHAESSGSEGVLVVIADSLLKKPEDLRGMRFCFTNESSATGYLLPRAYLREASMDPEEDLGRSHMSGNHIEVLRDLDAGLCDVGCTFMDIYARADEVGVDASRLRLLDVTGWTPHDAFVSGPAATLSERMRLRQALLNFDPQVEFGVARIGKMERLSGFSMVQDDVYEALRRAVE